MANQLIIPFLNPMRLVSVGTPQYKQFDNDWYKNLVKPFEQRDNYAQKWLPGTPIKFQFKSNFGPLQLDVIKCSGEVITSITPVAVPTNLVPTGFTVYEATVNPPNISDTWYVLLKVGTGETLEQHISEPQATVNSSNLLTVQYKNSFNDGDVVFETGIEFTLCVEAVITRLLPKAKRSVWEDQPMNLKTIQAVPYRQFKFMTNFIPDWMADKLNRIFCMTYVSLDGVEYTQVEGAEWEPTSVDRYARQAFTTDIRVAKNRTSLVSENNNSPAESFAIVYNIDTRAFGTFNGNPSGNDLQITKVE